MVIPAAGRAQQSYSWEVSGFALDNDFSDLELTSVGGTHYFDRIEVGDEPYDLAAFFDPATFVSATLDRPIGSTTDIWEVGGRYLLSDSLWYVGGRHFRQSTERHRNGPNEWTVDEDGYGIVVGKYLGPRTTLELAFDTSRREASGIGIVPICLSLPCPIGTEVTRSDNVSLSFVHARQFGALTYAFTGGLEQADFRTSFRDVPGIPGVDFLELEPVGQTVRSYSLGATLYPTKALGVHVGYEDDDYDFTEGTYSLGARWFFRRNVAIEVGFSQTRYDYPDAIEDDFEQRSLRIIGRF